MYLLITNQFAQCIVRFSVFGLHLSFMRFAKSKALCASMWGEIDHLESNAIDHISWGHTMSAGIDRTRREQQKKAVYRRRWDLWICREHANTYFVTAACCSLCAYMILVQAWSRHRLHATCWTLEVNNVHEIDRSKWRLMCVCSSCSGYSEQLHDFRSTNVDYISWYRTFISNRFANSQYPFWAVSFYWWAHRKHQQSNEMRRKVIATDFRKGRERENDQVSNSIQSLHRSFCSAQRAYAYRWKRKSILAFPIQIPYEIPLPELFV